MMTKKERAEFDALIKRAETLAALRWTAAVAPDLAPPDTGDRYTSGWIFNAHSAVVELAWSGYVSHGTGELVGGKPPRFYGSQNARRLYSTKLLALRAMRHEVERICADKLRQIDSLISAEEKP